MQKQIDLQGMQFGKKTDQVLKATAEPIDAPGHDQIELPLGGVATQAIKFRAAVPALSVAYAMVPIDADDLAAHAGSDLAKLTLLVRRSLLGARDAKVENGAFHRKAFLSASKMARFAGFSATPFRGVFSYTLVWLVAKLVPQPPSTARAASTRGRYLPLSGAALLGPATPPRRSACCRLRRGPNAPRSKRAIIPLLHE